VPDGAAIVSAMRGKLSVVDAAASVWVRANGDVGAKKIGPVGWTGPQGTAQWGIRAVSERKIPKPKMWVPDVAWAANFSLRCYIIANGSERWKG